MLYIVCSIIFTEDKKGLHYKASVELYKAAIIDYYYIYKAVLAYYIKLVKGYSSALINGWLYRVEYKFIYYNKDSKVNIKATLGPPLV
jgi:hypothetical protein